MKYLKLFDGDGRKYQMKLISDVQPLKDKTISALNVRSGEKYVDIGCGKGVDAIRIAEMSGPTGLVMGIALKDSALQSARGLAMEKGMESWVQFIKADACNLPLADEQFDGCNCERVLQHLSDPFRAVREMSRVLKHGGRVVLMDTDWSTFAIDCDDMEIVINCEMKFRKNSTSGRRLFAFARSAGIFDIQVTTSTKYFTDLAYADYVCGIAAMIRNAVIRGVIEIAAGEKLVNELISKDQKKQFFAMVTGVLVSGIKS